MSKPSDHLADQNIASDIPQGRSRFMAAIIQLSYAAARRYRNFPIRIKLAATTFAITAVAVGILIFFVSRTANDILGESLVTVENLQRNLILLGIVVLAFASAASIFLARTLTAPIMNLIETASRVEAGDLFARAAVETNDEIGALANAFNNMTIRLQDTLLGLERRVAERARALETSIEVSRSLSTILEREQLVAEVVELVRAAFGYYHTHVYLVDENSGDLVMAGGTGEAGLVMLGRGHKIARGKGLVGRAAATHAVVLAPDVSEEEDWLPNPLLPETKAEIAVPITIGEQVLGVLDVQHDKVGGLSEEDAQMLQAVASQVAIALRNARLFEQVQRQAEQESQINAISSRIRAADSIEDVLQIAARELGQALPVHRATVQVGPVSQGANGKKAD